MVEEQSKVAIEGKSKELSKGKSKVIAEEKPKVAAEGKPNVVVEEEPRNCTVHLGVFQCVVFYVNLPLEMHLGLVDKNVSNIKPIVKTYCHCVICHVGLFSGFLCRFAIGNAPQAG